jgi:hypothetical protein
LGSIGRLGVFVGRAVVTGWGLARRCAVRRLGGLRALVGVSMPTTPSASAPPPPGASRLLGGNLANLFWLVDHGLRRLEGDGGLLGRGDSCGVIHGTGLGCGFGRSPSTPRGGLGCVSRCDEHDAGRDHRRGDDVDRVGGDVSRRSGRGRGKGLRRSGGFGGDLLR